MFSKLRDQNFSFDKCFGPYGRYLLGYYFMYVGISWSWKTKLSHISGMVNSSTSLFESFEALFEIFSFARLITSLSQIPDLVLEHRSRVSKYTACNLLKFIFRTPFFIGRKALYRDGKDYIRWRFNVVRLKIVRISCIHTFLLLQICLGSTCSSVTPLV